MLPKAIPKIVLPLVFLAACSSAVQYEAVDPSRGGIRAKVTEILGPQEVAMLHIPCMPLMVPDGEKLQWLRTEFRRGHMRSGAVVLAYEGQQVPLNSAVEIRPQSCADGKLYRVVSVLKMLPAQ